MRDEDRRAFQAFIDQLPPGQRERFQKNLQMWKDLPAKERDALLKQAEFRKNRIKRDIDEAIQKSGLQLDGSRRDEFVKRYFQERRKIEEQLRKEMEEHRRPLLDDAIGRLKKEFSEPAASPSPAPSATPEAAQPTSTP